MFSKGFFLLILKEKCDENLLKREEIELTNITNPQDIKYVFQIELYAMLFSKNLTYKKKYMANHDLKRRKLFALKVSKVWPRVRAKFDNAGK